MLKILYAAANNVNAKIQLSRFLQAMDGKPFIIKVAAYKKSSPKNVSIDWTLDCLLNMFKPEHISVDNHNFVTYYEQVKYYNPDLIISDMEYFTSYIANVLSTTIWQCSSSLINFALPRNYKYDLGVFSKHAHTFNKNPLHVQRLIHILDNSNSNLLYSHFGDHESPPPLLEGFEWIKPYHQVGKASVPCQHNIVAGLNGNNKKILDVLKKFPDSVVFSEFLGEKHTNLLLKDIENEEEYFCNLRNSSVFVCEGQTSFLADAFYNDKHSAVFVNLKDAECIINSTISEKLGLSSAVYQIEDLKFSAKQPIIKDNGHQFLHERIEAL
jgi:hypothetical protein